jgi:hypothetical protein
MLGGKTWAKGEYHPLLLKARDSLGLL